MLPLSGPVATPRLATRLAGLDLPNPVGLAAGFDKNAEALTADARGLRFSRGRRRHPAAAARQPEAAALPADRGPGGDQPLRLQQ
jgi:dihydroorotate dehydrogenase